MTKINPDDIANFIDKAAKVLTDIGIKKPFTIYINQAQYSKAVISAFKEAHLYDMFLKIIKNGKVVDTLKNTDQNDPTPSVG